MTESPIFEMSPDTRLLRQKLQKLPVGSTMTYQELSDAISKPVEGGTSCLQSAVRSLLKRDQMVFAAIRNVGLKRLNDTDIVAASVQDVVSIRRKARKAVRKLGAVQDYNAMPGASRLSHTARISVLAAIADMSTDKSLDRMEKVSVGRSSELPFSDTIKAFLS